VAGEGGDGDLGLCKVAAFASRALCELALTERRFSTADLTTQGA
jgi:hypothetical protein